MGAALAQTLVEGPPALTQQMVDVAIRANEMIMNLKMKPAHKQRFTAVLVEQWQRGGELHEQLPQLQESFAKLTALPERTQRLALASTRLTFLNRLERDAKNGDEISVVMLQAFREAHKPINPAVPMFNNDVADAYIDAYLFHGSIMSNKPAPRLGAESRQKLRVELARDYSRMSQEQRDQMNEVLGRITSYMIQWPTLDELEKLMVRAQIGAPLSMQERELVQQARHMMSNHNMQMMTNELNFMRDSQQMIMGSAPYWNPTTQSWEQKGGIVTEFR